MAGISFEKSFASHEKAKYWSSKNKVSPEEVTSRSNKKYIFDCDKCFHEFDVSLSHIVHSNNWCPYCVNQKLCLDLDCQICLKKSFASHEKSKFWSLKNETNPRECFMGSSRKKYIFDCSICHHDFEMVIRNVTGKKQWCSYCASKQLCKSDDCKFCFEKSFASHEKSRYWSEKNTTHPRDVFKSSDLKFLFNCDRCNSEFDVATKNVNLGKWCPHCLKKTELLMFNFLKDLNLNVVREARFDWCKNILTNRKPPYDFLLKDYNIIIEVDGVQHFEQVSNWRPPDDIQKRDVYKMKQAIENGYTLIRILQTDVFGNKNDWKENIKKHLYIHDQPDIVFLSTNDEYEKHNELYISCLTI